MIKVKTHINTEEMVAQFRAGNIAGFNHLFSLHYPALCYFCNALLKDQSTAEEMAQDAFVKLWQHRERYTTAATIKSFLYQASRNACIDLLRTQRNVPIRVPGELASVEEATEPAEHLIIRAEVIAKIHRSIEDLPKQSRKVFKLYYLEEKSYEEIARELKLSINNVRNHKARALQMLRGTIGNALGSFMITAVVFLLLAV